MRPHTHTHKHLKTHLLLNQYLNHHSAMPLSLFPATCFLLLFLDQSLVRQNDNPSMCHDGAWLPHGCLTRSSNWHYHHHHHHHHHHQSPALRRQKPCACREANRLHSQHVNPFRAIIRATAQKSQKPQPQQQPPKDHHQGKHPSSDAERTTTTNNSNTKDSIYRVFGNTTSCYRYHNGLFVSDLR